jgi:4-hydroxybenzoate polyprenyltransferase
MILSTITLRFSESLTIYAGSVWVFNMMVTFLTPYYFILLTRTYHPARAVTVGNTCLLLGFSLGPLLIGYTVNQNQFGVSICATIGVLMLSVALVLIYAVMAKTERRGSYGENGI